MITIFKFCLKALINFLFIFIFLALDVQASDQRSQKIDWGIEIGSLVHTANFKILKKDFLSDAQKQDQAQIYTQQALRSFGYFPYKNQATLFIQKGDDVEHPTHLLMIFPKINFLDWKSSKNGQNHFPILDFPEGRVQEGHSISSRHHFLASNLPCYDETLIIRFLTYFDESEKLCFYELRDSSAIAKDHLYKTNHPRCFRYPSTLPLPKNQRLARAVKALL